MSGVGLAQDRAFPTPTARCAGPRWGSGRWEPGGGPCPSGVSPAGLCLVLGSPVAPSHPSRTQKEPFQVGGLEPEGWGGQWHPLPPSGGRDHGPLRPFLLGQVVPPYA